MYYEYLYLLKKSGRAATIIRGREYLYLFNPLKASQKYQMIPNPINEYFYS